MTQEDELIRKWRELTHSKAGAFALAGVIFSHPDVAKKCVYLVVLEP